MTFEVYDDYQICLDGVWVATVRSGLTATQLDEVKRLLREADNVAALLRRVQDLTAELEMLR